MFGGPVILSCELGSEWKEISVENKYLGKTNIINHSGRSNEAPKQSNYRGIGLAEMIYSIENNRKHRCNDQLALHVLVNRVDNSCCWVKKRNSTAIIMWTAKTINWRGDKNITKMIDIENIEKKIIKEKIFEE